MSNVQKYGFLDKLKRTRSLKSLNAFFYKNTRVGQKYFLYNDRLPRVINISFNEHTCMYQCRFCRMHKPETRDMYRHKQEMSWETLKNLVRNIPNDSYYSFDMSSIGETLEFENLPDFIAYMKREKPLVNTIISTNGLLLTPEKMKALVKSGLDNMQLSLFAANKDDYEWICKGKQYETVCENIRKAVEIRNNMNSRTPHMQVFIAGINEFKDKFKDFVDYWSGIVDVAFVRPINNSFINEEISQIFETNPYRYPCISPWYSTSIRSNGDVLACQVIHFYDSAHKIGNINEKSLEEIWNGKEKQEWRQRHLEKRWHEMPYCRNCNVWDAYTNIWDWNGKQFQMTIKWTDFFKKSASYRGA
ncbi:MAG: radical SAM/SPASM domain-containing protein [Candidatus Omnitrophota bacterium]